MSRQVTSSSLLFKIPDWGLQLLQIHILPATVTHLKIKTLHFYNTILWNIENQYFNNNFDRFYSICLFLRNLLLCISFIVKNRGLSKTLGFSSVDSIVIPMLTFSQIFNKISLVSITYEHKVPPEEYPPSCCLMWKRF